METCTRDPSRDPSWLCPRATRSGLPCPRVAGAHQVSVGSGTNAPSLLVCPRLVLSRFEFEGVATGESSLEAGEDEEEVWLFWRAGHKEVRSKSVRELAQDAKEGQKEDRDVLGYYR